VVRVITDRTDFERLVDPPAGGDGTAANAARTVAGRAIPLAVLPLGTANNIARSLGYVGSIEELIRRSLLRAACWTSGLSADRGVIAHSSRVSAGA
jgi:diacylglycerol kinase family enzyme